MSQTSNQPQPLLLEDIEWVQQKNRDDVGRVFKYNNRIFRAIYNDKKNYVIKLLNSSFFADLTIHNLFPKTWISKFSLPDFDLIVEHEVISPIIYPQEWSFSMLKDAALMIIQVAKLCRKYNYNMKDCHSLNVVFSGNKPFYVDLGSFHEGTNLVSGWEPYEEFLRCYYYPLYMWSSGQDFTSKLSIFSGHLMPHHEFYTFKYKFLSIFSSGAIDLFFKLKISPYLFTINPYLGARIKSNSTFLYFLFRPLIAIAKHRNNQSLDLFGLEKKIQALQKKKSRTQWSDYQSINIQKQERYSKVISLINSHCTNITSAIDIAGNQGLFSCQLLEHTSLQHVICQDLDEYAINTGYNQFKSQPFLDNKSLQFVNYNPFTTIIRSGTQSADVRFNSDLVVSLALLHHLVLTQGYSFEYVLDILNGYTSRYICIEFMPKGLWSRGSKVSVPSFYTLDSFSRQFTQKFSLLAQHQVDENYIVFIGEKISRH